MLALVTGGGLRKSACGTRSVAPVAISDDDEQFIDDRTQGSEHSTCQIYSRVGQEAYSSNGSLWVLYSTGFITLAVNVHTGYKTEK